MIRLRLSPPLLVSAHMIVGIELSPEKATIDVHTPDGQYWELTAEDIGAPINEQTLLSLAAEIDRQCKEHGAAVHMTRDVARAIENRIDPDDEPFARATKWNRNLDDEIPF